MAFREHPGVSHYSRIGPEYLDPTHSDRSVSPDVLVREEGEEEDEEDDEERDDHDDKEEDDEGYSD
jgi:hypothetical protein